MNCDEITTMTCIYAPNAHTEKITLECLRRVREAVGPDVRVMAGLDLASEAFENSLSESGVDEAFRPGRGKPPRMSRMLKEAVARCKTPYLLTIESDVWIEPDTARMLLNLLEASEDTVACIEARYCNRKGKPEYPLRSWQSARRDGAPGVRIQRAYANWGCTLWRVDALRKLIWARIPPLRHADIQAGTQLRSLGYEFGVAAEVFALHHCMQSFRARMAMARKRKATDKRGVVLTAIFGGKDWLHEPRACDPDLEYHCFTDDPDLTSSLWTIHYHDSEHMVPMLAAKEFKVFPHRYFPDAEVIVWQDASFTQRRPYGPLIDKYLSEATPIAFFAHQAGRTTLKAEVAASQKFDVENPERCHELLRHAWRHGFRARRQLVECGLNFRLNTPLVHWLMDLWWHYITNWTHQDQISMPLCAYLLGMDYAVITEKRDQFARLSRHLIATRGQWRDWNEELPIPGGPNVGLATPRQ